jgi:hypothetical protein
MRGKFTAPYREKIGAIRVFFFLPISNLNSRLILLGVREEDCIAIGKALAPDQW